MGLCLDHFSVPSIISLHHPKAFPQHAFKQAILAELPKNWCGTIYPGSGMAKEAPGPKEILLQAAAQELGPEAFETVKLSDVDTKVPEAKSTLPGIPPCITQKAIPQNLKQNPVQIMVGMKSNIPRWKPGSVVKWSAWRMGFASQEDADYAAVQLSIAADKWNEANVGVTFEYVNLAKDANFVVCHGGSLGTVLASAYFPNADDLNFVYIYSYAFQPDWKPSLWKVLTHELGHVLGLRHEFAMGMYFQPCYYHMIFVPGGRDISKESIIIS